MSSFFQRPRVRAFLKAFKWCRVTVLFLILLVVVVLTYLQLVGLPDFLKRPLLQALRDRGFEAQFTDAHLAWGPSIVIENGSFSPTNLAAGPHLSAALTQLDLNYAALLRARLHMDGIDILKANLRIPVAPTNQEPLLLTNVNLHITLRSNSLAQLSDSSGWVRGVRFQIDGEFRNFESVRDWRLPPLPNIPNLAGAGTNEVAPSRAGMSPWEVIQKIQFSGTPELKIHITGDGLDRNTLRSEVEFTAAGTQSPWCHTGSLYLRAACAHVFKSDPSPFFQTRFLAQDVTTPWAAGRDLSASVDFSREAATNFFVDLHLNGHDVSTAWNVSGASNWVRVATVHCDGNTRLPSPMFKPDKAAGSFQAKGIQSGWGSADTVSLTIASERTNDFSLLDEGSGPWNIIKGIAVDCQANATNVATPKLKLDRVALDLDWQAPQLAIKKLEAVMYRGHFNASANLNVASREVQTHGAVDFDPHQITSLLTGPAQHWISLYNWETPPNVSADLRFVLPPWTNRVDAWPEESSRSLQLAGDFSVGRGAFRDIAITSARSHFSYSNQTWNLSGMRVQSAESSLNLDFSSSDVTRDYHFRFESKMDPMIALPLLTQQQQQTLNEVSFSDKPEVQGDVWGNWKDISKVGFNASLATSHFVIRGEPVNQLNANAEFTNRFLNISQLNVVHDTGRVQAPYVGIHFDTNRISISMSNAVSTVDPEPVRRALGKNAPPFMKEIHFDSPPTVTASGSFTPGDDMGTAMHFIVQGSKFHWTNLTVDSVRGEVDYHVRTVVVSNVQGTLYGNGKLDGNLTIDWSEHKTRFDSDFNVSDINLGPLARELTREKTKLEGRLDGHLALSAPYGGNETNLFGSGWLHVHNGLLWDIKIFGVFSPVLNAIAPGAGQSRAREASTSFTMTNGVISTDSLEIRSTGFRLTYKGTIDTQKRLNAVVEANLLRDTPLFGHLLSWMLTPVDKMFEYRVTGTLNKPVVKPVYIPKFFLDLLRPFHSLKELLPPPSPTKPNSNGSPTKSDGNSQPEQ